MKRIALALTALLALVSVALAGSSTPPNGPFTPPNTTVACGRDGTVAIQAALNNAASNNGIVSLPPCPQTNPILISATLNIPSNRKLSGMGRGITWLKEADNTNAAPLIQNSNAGGGANLLLDSNIAVTDLSIDGNAANQTSLSTVMCISFLGVANVSVLRVDVLNCRSTAVQLNGNTAPDATPAAPAFVDELYVSGGGTTAGNGIGLQMSNRQRRASVSNVYVENTMNHGVLIDASEGNYSNIRAKKTGQTGSGCANAGATTVDNPGGGGASQHAWSPCPAGIYVRNVTSVTGVGLVAEQGQFYGIVIAGTRDSSFSSIVAQQNSLKSTGVWDDLHIDYNPLVGYGENHNLTINGAVLGANAQTIATSTNSINPPTSRYGLFINDGQAGSFGDATISNAGTGYSVGNTLTCSGGTQTEPCVLSVTTAPGGVITGLATVPSGGSGVYTVLPANPVSLTGGGGTNASINITWSTAYLTGILIGQCVTAKTRTPAFITNWTVQTSAGNFGP